MLQAIQRSRESHLSQLIIRDAEREDADAMLEIYVPFVRDTAVSFELKPPSIEQFRGRITSGQRAFPWLVAMLDCVLVGYSYATAHRTRGAYRYSVEASAYVAEGRRCDGVGRALYTKLLDRLESMGYCNAYAGVTLPNPASESFHRAMGFLPVGVFHSVGYKFNRWHDLAWWHRRLRDLPLERDDDRVS